MTPDVLRHRPQVVTALESKRTLVELTCRQTGNEDGPRVYHFGNDKYRERCCPLLP